ncbi:molecular chaperone [Shewanella sp. CG12_big_fil_rev_8_21_14_0_65_47_15]|uniref:molecular chaperone n=1 Tax=Shewanella sp. CG12_big_fil_rev_8_21_14_0_65_47_15 TaxID=1975537 RepID=UPI000CB48E51|nr:molecular chaperone [Shewanella sp. CG12_big_fil_rev_8_21_14_0_65_47_15]PIW59239.1 MAG: molecular chaperone [Shewanella sp. CG12_big_fil_rev_8_21_14_0_65_47_15]
MFVGFDYGSANCAVGIMQGESVQLLPLSEDSTYLPSTLYAMDRELIAEAVYQALPIEFKTDYAKKRAAQLSRARMVRHELDLDPDTQAVFVGEQAVKAYLETPEEGFYVRSPKSFLGATGLRPEQIALFEDIVTLMMQHIKVRAESILVQRGMFDSGAKAITHAVIGRPVNFQGIGGEESNRQAEAILSLAATRAGFVEVAFLFEPLAAGMDYEASLREDKTVLVVDVGGGTTDCSVVKMGPSHIMAQDRAADCLGHSGQRIGGNDLDIALAMNAFMPHFGLGSLMINGKPMPSNPFWNAVAVNDISAQREFATLSTRKLIDELIKEAEQPQLLLRLLKVQRQQLSYQLVRLAERAKIVLSDQDKTDIELDFIEAALRAAVSRQLFENAIEPSLTKVEALMHQALSQAAKTLAERGLSLDALSTDAAQVECLPDVIYVTGGTARSPAIYGKIAGIYPDIPVVVGDHFGSVTAGLTRWAQKLFVKQ